MKDLKIFTVYPGIGCRPRLDVLAVVESRVGLTGALQSTGEVTFLVPPDRVSRIRHVLGNEMGVPIKMAA